MYQICVSTEMEAKTSMKPMKTSTQKSYERIKMMCVVVEWSRTFSHENECMCMLLIAIIIFIERILVHVNFIAFFLFLFRFLSYQNIFIIIIFRNSCCDSHFRFWLTLMRTIESFMVQNDIVCQMLAIIFYLTIWVVS